MPGWRAVVCLCCLLEVVLAWGSPDLARADAESSSQPLYGVGIDRQLPPYSFVDRSGQPQGLVIDLLREIGRVMEIRFEWRVGTQDELRQALLHGELDLLAAVPASLANEGPFLLSESHSFLEDAYFVRGGEGGGAIRAVRSLDGLEVVTIADDPAQDYVRKLSESAVVEIEPDLADALRELAAGGGDLALLPRRPGTLLMRQLQLSNLRVLPQTLDEYTRALSFAALPKHGELIRQLDQGLIIITENGSFLRLYSEWESRGDDAVDWKRVAWIVAPVLLLLVLSMSWTWLLRREVARRTEDLRRAETEKRAVEQRIAQAQKLESLAVLAGGVAHDFNNLLMAMLGNTSLALLQAPADSPLTNRLREIEKAGRRAAELCQQMLNYSGRGRLLVEKIDVGRLILAMRDLLEATLPKNVKLVLSLGEGLPAVDGDPGQLRQIVVNLVSNASEAVQSRSDQGGAVTLTTRLSDGPVTPKTDLADRLARGYYVILEVGDNGVGMDENIRARIFEPFFTTKFTGRGLGLAATLGILRGHNGGIQVETRPGEGSVFRVFLPVSPGIESTK